jgi:glycosyltransferase involved in cell wall biosynthesis
VKRPLTIFIPHCSDLLTDHLPHGDGLVAHGFISRLAQAGHKLHIVAQNVDLREPLGPNVTIYSVPTFGNGRMLWRLGYMRHVRRLFWQVHRKAQFDLIHQLNPVFTGLSLSLAGSGVPLVLGTYVPHWPADSSGSRLAHSVNRFTESCRGAISVFQQWCADTLVLTTPAATNRLPFAHAHHEKICFLPHGINTDLFSPAPGTELTHQNEAPSILFFANVVKRKGIFTLIDAFPSVAKQFPSVHLLIAGDGPDLPEAKRRVAELSCAQQVVFLGRQSRANAPAMLGNCTIYCLPSFGEPYATTLIEAMSCGKPVITTTSGGSPHLVSPKGGVLFPAGDTHALARALCELLADPLRCSAMGRHNRQFVVANMGWDCVIHQLEGIYEKTLQRFASHHGNHRRGLLLLNPGPDIQE